jgi:hypothetical protein
LDCSGVPSTTKYEVRSTNVLLTESSSPYELFQCE